jgi:hypothetical protein
MSHDLHPISHHKVYLTLLVWILFFIFLKNAMVNFMLLLSIDDHIFEENLWMLVVLSPYQE